MDRPISILLLAAALAAAQPTSAFAGPPPDCGIPAAGDADATPIRSRAELDAWLDHCPSPLDLMTPGARARFLDGLAFNERGLSGLSTADLNAELTADELGQVMRLLGLGAPATAGLLPEEANILRAARAAEPEADPGEVEARFNTLYYAADDLPDQSRAQDAELIGAHYESLFPDDELKTGAETVGIHDLRLLYRAARTAAWHTHADAHLDAMAGALDELERRGLATRDDITTMHDMLIHAGRLEDSRRFAGRHAAAGLRPLPPVSEPVAVGHDAPSAWNVSVSEDVLLHEAVALEPIRIVVVASYGCGFSQAAARAIPQDPELGPIFREHAVWLASPAHLDNLEALRHWNHANPEATLVVAAARERWPMLDLDRVPQFHVFRDGELVASVTSGWPLEEGNRDAVLAALRKAGLEGP